MKIHETITFGALLLASLPVQLRSQAPGITPRLPQAFVENEGQWPAHVAFATRKGPMAAWFHDDGWTFTLETTERAVGDAATPDPTRAPALPDGVVRGVAITMRLDGAAPRRPSGVEQQPGRHNFLLGSDPGGWVTGARGFGRLRYRTPYPGIDVVVRRERSGAPGGIFEYDFCLEPGADLEAVVVRCEGDLGLRVAPDGSLVMATSLGDVVQSPPVTWMGDGPQRRFVPCRYVLHGAGCFGFEVSGWDRAQPLTVDPGLVWSSYLGGSDEDVLQGVDVHPGGTLTVVGNTRSWSFPTKTPYQRALKGVADAFVTRLTPDGAALVFSTFLGGSDGESCWKVAVDAAQQTTVAGSTGSSDFPTTPGVFQPRSAGGRDAWVTRLDASGSSLVFSTYIGGSSNEGVQSFHVNASGETAVGGPWASPNFPTTSNAPQRQPGRGDDGWATVLDGQGRALLSTLLGGNGDDWVSGMTGGGGVLTVALGSRSSDMPVTANAYQATFGGGTDVFVARISYTATAGRITYGSYFGTAQNQWPFGCHVDANGVITLAGGTGSIPTTPGAHRTNGPLGGTDAFLSRIDPSRPPAQQLIYSTYVGRGGYDNGVALHVDADGVATVVGFTSSTDLPVTPGAFQSTFGGGNTRTFWLACDSYIARYRMDATLPPAEQLLYCSYVGAPNAATNEFVWDVHVDANGVATVAGWGEAGFPVRGGYQPRHGGGDRDGLLVRLVTTPGYGTFGSSCGGSTIALAPDSLPRLGKTMTLRLANQPASLPAALFLGLTRLSAPFDLAPAGMPGCLLHVQPDLTVPLAPAQFTLSVPVPFDRALVGVAFFNQAIAVDRQANAAGLVLSNAGCGMIGY